MTTMTIGKFAQTTILSNPTWTNQQVLDHVKLNFPNGKTSMACIAWYKSDMRKKGELAKRGAQQVSLADQIKALEEKLEAMKLQALEEATEEVTEE